MHGPILGLLVRSCVSVAARVVLILSAGVTPANAAESFTPTMKDMLSLQGAVECASGSLSSVTFPSTRSMPITKTMFAVLPCFRKVRDAFVAR